MFLNKVVFYKEVLNILISLFKTNNVNFHTSVILNSEDIKTLELNFVTKLPSWCFFF